MKLALSASKLILGKINENDRCTVKSYLYLFLRSRDSFGSSLFSAISVSVDNSVQNILEQGHLEDYQGGGSRRPDALPSGDYL